jgi:CMP-N,N'-diacetyllegionaminic acid synthase
MTPLRPILGLVPARAGSKGIPGKNLRLLAGRPLVAHAIEAARASGIVDRVVVSTDSEEIAAAGRAAGAEVPFLRPAALATDEAPMLPVVLHAVAELEREGWSPAVVVLLQPTAPLRRPEHIRAAIRLLERTGCDAVVSVVAIPAHYAPDFALKVVGDRLEFFLPEGARTTRRQDARPAYSRDGSVYAVRRDVLVTQQSLYGRDCRPLVLPRSESANLDDPEDWARAEALLRARSD